MNRSWMPRMKVLVVAMPLAALQFAGLAGDDASAAAPPKDPCALLKPADIQTLDPNAKISNGVSTEKSALGSMCQYLWGPRTSEWGQTSLIVTVVEVSKVWPGLNADQVKRRVAAEVKSGGPDAAEIPGIGDGALFVAEPKNHNAKARAYVVKEKDVLLELTFHGGNAGAQKDKLVALLKAAIAAL
jgi:hypothetical protein